jgi:hypothetical protein
MNEYLVFMDSALPGTVTEVFYCHADDREHAESQAKDAYPAIDGYYTARVCRVINLDE